MAIGLSFETLMWNFLSFDSCSLILRYLFKRFLSPLSRRRQAATAFLALNVLQTLGKGETFLSLCGHGRDSLQDHLLKCLWDQHLQEISDLQGVSRES